MHTAVAITVRNHLSELERVGTVVEQFAAAHAIPARVAFEINLALDEVLTNIISYGYDDGGEHAIHVSLSADAGQLVVTVEDDGRAFNPLDAPAPDVDQSVEARPIGGLGIHLVRKVMDGLEYARRQGKNHLVMKKAIVVDG